MPAVSCDSGRKGGNVGFARRRFPVDTCGGSSRSGSGRRAWGLDRFDHGATRHRCPRRRDGTRCYRSPMDRRMVESVAAAVGVFFSISGFLAYYVLRRDEQRLGKISYSYFLWRRILRIWRVLRGHIRSTGATAYIGNLHRQPFDLFQLFTFTSNLSAASWQMWPPSWLGPLWTIAVEEQFYLIAPLIYLAMRSRFSVAFCIGGIVAANAARSGLYFASGRGRQRRSLLRVRPLRHVSRRHPGGPSLGKGKPARSLRRSSRFATHRQPWVVGCMRESHGHSRLG